MDDNFPRKLTITYMNGSEETVEIFGSGKFKLDRFPDGKTKRLYLDIENWSDEDIKKVRECQSSIMEKLGLKKWLPRTT